MSRFRVAAFTSVVALILVAVPSAALAVGGTAPGAPGANAIWTPANKTGFGTSTTTTSKVWHTLQDGKLTEVYYPDLGTPSVRDLQFVVSDGKTARGTSARPTRSTRSAGCGRSSRASAASTSLWPVPAIPVSGSRRWRPPR